MAKKTIKIKKYSDVIEELTATAVAITPGMLVEATSTEETCQAHSAESGNVLPMFAVEDEMQGKGIGDNYAASAKIQVWIPGRGDIVLAIIEDGTTIAIGDFLESNGAGLLQKYVADKASWASDGGPEGSITVYPNAIVGQAVEAVAVGAASSENSSESPLALGRRIQVRII